MKKMLSIITRKGQITLPAEFRAALGLKRGDKVAITLSDPETGTVLLKPVRSVAEMTFGALSSHVSMRSPKEEHAAFEEGTAEEVALEDLPKRSTG
jgi:AbrB family looped-hinge helix DNA binding protein